ncbi:MAG: GTPase [Candidatus Aenigmarchaeota archaeon]|nr:GTPase [Candidatus Aenigmarchaeota archaeon]
MVLLERVRVIIMGAAGRDFHNFNVVFRDNPRYNVACFTAAQIPDIAGRNYPHMLAGKLYPKGIPIYPEERLPAMIKKFNANMVVLAYSDLSHEDVMHKASIALSSGADFMLLGPGSTMIKSKRPVISVCAVRTGAGKSQTTRKIASMLKSMRKRVVIVRHPMPYGDLSREVVQRFAAIDDLMKYNCTIEEHEEYEQHINNGFIVYAGVDYEKILREAEKEADIVIWDGGNNDFPFYKTDLHIVVADPHRPGNEVSYHPGETNVRMADVVIINKIDTAEKKNVEIVENNIKKLNPKAVIIKAKSPLSIDSPAVIKGKRVLAIEDGPTVTHGNMPIGAAGFAAKSCNAKLIDPRPYAVGSIMETYAKYPHLGPILPAMGYSNHQIKELENTVNSTPCDAVIVGTPIDLRKIIRIKKPSVKVTYSLEEIGKPDLKDIITRFLKKSK